MISKLVISFYLSFSLPEFTSNSFSISLIAAVYDLINNRADQAPLTF
jgi:hypothetical protein